MAIDAYILPFPDGVMGFVNADPARLPVRGGRITLTLYGPAEATTADQAALRSRFIESLGSIIRSEGGYAAAFWPRLWWTVGGLLSLVFLILVALPSGLSFIWLTFLVALLALPGGVGPLVRGWRARRLLRRLRRLHDVEVVPGRSRATADRMAALWTVAGRLRGSALDVLDQWKVTALRPGGPARRDCTVTTVYAGARRGPRARLARPMASLACPLSGRRATGTRDCGPTTANRYPLTKPLPVLT